MRKIKNTKAKEIVFISIAAFFIILSVAQDILDCGIPDFLIVKILNVEDLFINLFTVQATISGLSFAIVALITGFIDKTVYGISVSKYISKLKPFILNHKLLLIADLVLTGFNYIFLSFELFNATIILFFISICISIKLIYDVYFVFYGNDVIDSTIEEYVLNNYDEEYLKKINRELSKEINNNNTVKINEYLYILKKVFSTEINGSKRKQIIILIEKCYVDSFNYAVKCESTAISLSIMNRICDIYKMSNENATLIPLKIWDEINISYYKLLKQFNYTTFNSYNFTLIYEFRKSLYKNRTTRFENGKVIFDNHYNMQSFYPNVYNNMVLNNKNFSLDEQNSIKEYLLNNIVTEFILLKNQEFNPDHTAFDELIELLIIYIKDGNLQILKDYYFSKIKYHNNNKYISISFVIACAYIYYLGYREKLVDNKALQINALGIFNSIKSRLKHDFSMIKFNEIFENYRNVIKEKFNNFEYFVINKFKKCIIDDIANDFLFFTIIELYGNYFIVDLIEKFSYEELVEACMRYIKCSKEVKPLFIEHANHFFNLNSNINQENKYNNFIDILKKYSKKREFERADEISKRITQADYNNFSYNIGKVFKDVLNDLINELSSNSNKHKNGENAKTIQNQFTIQLYLSEYTKKFNAIKEEYLELFKNNLPEYYNKIIYNHIFKEKANWEDNNNHKKLLKLLNIHNICVDRLYGDKSVLWDLDSEKTEELFGEYKYVYNNDVFICLLDSSKIHFSIKNINVKLEKLSLSDIECQETEDNLYLFSTSYGTENQYTEQELYNYINKLRGNVIISFEIEYLFDDEYIGVGLKFDF